MMDGGTVVGAAGGAASMLPALFGRGKNNILQTGFVGKPGYDPNAPFYGGYEGGLQDYQNQNNQKISLVDGRGAPVVDYGQANQTRYDQGAIAQAMRARALGQTPSIASMEADRQMQQATAAQSSAAASARGPAAMALAQQNAAANTANAQSAISGQAQVNAANERMQAEQAAMGAYSNMRGQDTSQAQFDAQLKLQNRAQNDQRAMGYEQLGARANEAELGARTQNQATLAGAQSAADKSNQQTGDQNAQSKGLIDTIGDFFSDERAKILIPGGGMVSDTQAKRSALLEQGRRQGAAASKGGPSLDQMLDDRARGPNYGANADDAALDDRQKQFADQGIGKPALDKAIGDQVEADRKVGDSAMEQWQRSFGDPQAAVDSVRKSDNQAEANRIRARFGDGPTLSEGGSPPATSWWSALGAAGKNLSDAQFAPQRQPMYSDEEAKITPTSSGGDMGEIMDRLHAVHDIKSVGQLNQEANQTPGVAKMMAPGSPVATGDDELGAALSDVRGKDVVPLMDTDEGELRSTPDGRAYYAKPLEAAPLHPAFASRETSDEKPVLRAPSKAKAQSRKPTDDELLAAANKLKADMVDDYDRYAARGPAVGGELAAAQRDANRSMAGSPYAYKPGLTPASQKPGEINFGPMAQNMEQSPVAGTAVKTDPATGLKVIDRDKALKVVMSGVADLQRQQDETRALLAKGGRR